MLRIYFDEMKKYNVSTPLTHAHMRTHIHTQTTIYYFNLESSRPIPDVLKVILTNG